MKKLALDELARAKKFLTDGDDESAIYEARDGLLHLGRVIVMRNNIFTMIKPAEVLTEIRLLDPITYKLFLRAFKLKGMDEPKLLVILEEIKGWMEKTENQLDLIASENQVIEATSFLAQAQREHHGARSLTYADDYELAVLEMRQSTCSLGRSMVAAMGQNTEDFAFIPMLRISDQEFFKQVLVEYGAYDIQPAEINRIISEAQYLAHQI